LVVGRFLKLLGAESLEYEVPGSEGRQVDWLARFPDGPVSVEVTAPMANSVVGETIKARNAAIQMIVREAPPGWHVMVLSVPVFEPNESLRSLRKDVRALFDRVPQGSKDDRLEFHKDYDNGSLQITLFGAAEPGPARYGGGPGVGYIDDTSEVVHRAVQGKRLQARGAVKPVVAALFTGGFGRYEVEKFDIGLFGRTVHGGGFDPTGVFGSGHASAFAGALVFADLGLYGGSDPIFYLHPAYSGPLPRALGRIRRRELLGDRIEDRAGGVEGLVMQMGWPTDRQ